MTETIHRTANHQDADPAALVVSAAAAKSGAGGDAGKAAAPKPAASAARKKKEKRETYKDLNHAPPPVREEVEKLIAGGATFEDVVETLQERDGPRVTLRAVENYFRSNLELQKTRILRQMEVFNALKKALGDPHSEPDSGESQLADAALFIGLMGLTRHGPGFKDTQTVRLARENIRLRNHLMRLQERREASARSFTQARIKHELAKVDSLKLKMRLLEKALKEATEKGQLDQETLAKIQEIYGLIHEPYVPPEVREAQGIG